jgi:diguanylate cyclase (GGDEF)-like protein
LFLSDLVTPMEMNEAQLYPLALVPLYRVKIRHVLPLFCGLGIALIVGGYALSPSPDLWDGITTRTFSVMMLVVTAFSLIKLSGYERKLLMQSLTDPLTGLLNRRSFLELSGKEEAHTRRRGNALSVLMLDIDHFKRINDTYGHGIGDLAIKALADISAKTLRPTDILARYGGEEFVITLPETDSDHARVVAERLREAVADLSIPIDGGKLQFTVSIGVSTYARGEPLDQAIERADQALYRAKHNGRNRVEADGALEQNLAQV